jgi:hypothetical protein
MALLSTLPRGTGQLGFYESDKERMAIRSVRLAADVPPRPAKRTRSDKKDTPTFKAVVESLRNRGGDWYKVAAGHIEVCNVPLMVRPQK